MSSLRFSRGIALLSLLALAMPLAHADTLSPPLNSNLKDAFYHLPIPGIDKAMDGLFNALKKGEHGGYGAQTTVDIPNVGKVPLQLYFFGKAEKQVVMLVVDTSITVPKVFNNKAWQKLTGSKLSDPIFTVSTTDFTLATREMPPAFQKVVADSFFNVGALSFTSGFQVASRIHLSDVMKQTLNKTMGVSVQDFTMRAGLVIPIPTDASAAAELSAQIATDMKNVDKVIKDLPNFFVELQPAPGTKIVAPMHMSSLVLTDATFSLDTSLFLGFKGNLFLPSGKKFITYFDTPLPVEPVAIVDLASFDFGFTSSTVTYKDIVELSTAMSTPSANGTLIKGLDKYRAQLLSYANTLTVFELTNPNTVNDYVFGDPNKPFPYKGAFMLAIGGPTASTTDANGRSISGPYLVAQGNLSVLGERMGTGRLTVGEGGFHSTVTSNVTLKLGPLGRTGMSLRASADIDDKQQNLLLHSNVVGRTLDARLDATTLYVESPATCATPFSISVNTKVTSALQLESFMDNTPGINVDPAKISGCLGEDLKKAYQWVSTTGSQLGGYTASMATTDLKKITDAEYNAVKDAARVAANNVSNSATNAFRQADNAFRKLGFKKKKHRQGPDPRFAASVFDWDFYYDANQDLVRGGHDLPTSWVNGGFTDGRQGASTFNARFYLNRYIDVKQNCGNDLTCALNHWLNEGIPTGRQGSAQFSVSAYLHRYPDLRQSLGPENYSDLLQHWIDTGEAEGRNGSPDVVATGPVAGPRWAGAGGGTVWSDREESCLDGDFVTGFRLHTTKPVDGATFQYSYSKWGATRGSTLQPQTEVTLPRGEYFVRVDWNSTATISRMTFITNYGREFGPYGYNAGGYYSFSVTPGEKLGCMWGSVSSWLTQLVFSSTGAR